MADAGADSSVPGALLDQAAVRRGLEKHPLLARRLADVHAAYRRSQEQLRALDDRIDSGAADLHI